MATLQLDYTYKILQSTSFSGLSIELIDTALNLLLCTCEDCHHTAQIEQISQVHNLSADTLWFLECDIWLHIHN